MSSTAYPRHPRRRRIINRVTWHAALIVLAVLFILPLLWMLMTSLRSSQTALTGPIIPRAFTLQAYSYLFGQLGIGRNLINSIVVTGASVAITTAMATLAGYGFGRLDFRGRGAAFALLASALFLPSVAILIPLYIELQGIGLLGSLPGLILVYAAIGVPFSVFLMRAFFEGLPRELTEAAKVDGANEFQVFLYVILPLAAPGIATVATFQLITVWNELLLANALITSPQLLTLQPVVNSLIGKYSTNWPALTAGMTISVLPILIAYVFFQKWFIAGLTAGALKS